ncbi:ESX secretion-associated protein EspG [Nocardia nova]|uniref:ESX secretion-associated protein EspG n=1 Tax=Nocardia nova TaxID=37330 RepID=UPI0034000BF9
MSRWEFTHAELLYAWGQIGWDRIPAPLIVTPDVASMEQWESVERELRLRFPVSQNPDLLPVLKIAADPDMSLTLVGKRGKHLRAYGAVTSNIGVTMVQRSAPNPDSAGNILVQVGPPALVPKVFAMVAGNHPGGRVPSMVETWERIEDDRPTSWMVRDEPPVADRIRELLTAPRTGFGHIEIRPDRHTDRPRPPRYISWFDVEDDGRYTYTRRHGDFHVAPCNPQRLRTLLSRLME